MFIYYLLLFYLFFVFLIYKIDRNKESLSLLVGIPLAMIMGFRGIDVGTDTYNYLNMFKEVSRLSFHQILGEDAYLSSMLFYLLIKSFSILCNNYWCFQIFLAMIYIGGSIKYIQRLNYDMFYGIIIFLGSLFLGACNITRQMLVVMILMHSWIFLTEKKYYKALFLFTISCTIHATAIVYSITFFSYFLIKKYPRSVYILPALLLVLLFSYQEFIDRFSDGLELYSNYLNNHKGTQSAGAVKILWAIEVWISVHILYMSKRTNDFQKLSAVFVILYVACNIIGLEFNYFERLGLYFLPFVLIIYECYPRVIIPRYNKFFKIMVSVCYIIYFLLSASSDQYQYNFFF